MLAAAVNATTLALVAAADEHAAASARGEAVGPDEADGAAPVRRSLGS